MVAILQFSVLLTMKTDETFRPFFPRDDRNQGRGCCRTKGFPRVSCVNSFKMYRNWRHSVWFPKLVNADWLHLRVSPSALVVYSVLRDKKTQHRLKHGDCPSLEMSSHH